MGDGRAFNAEVLADLFLPTPSARRATSKGHDSALVLPQISTHALREEGDGVIPLHPRRTEKFLPTPSARRATVVQHEVGRRVVISTHALREEGDANATGAAGRELISTHALREEGDRCL